MQNMRLADRTLMEGLKQKCAVLLHPHVTPQSVLPLLQEATLLDAPRLVSSMSARCICIVDAFSYAYQ